MMAHSVAVHAPRTTARRAPMLEAGAACDSSSDVLSWGVFKMDYARGLGYLPDVPKVEDYDECSVAIAPLLHKTKLAHRVAAKTRAMGITGAAPPAAPAPALVDLRAWFSPIEDQGSLGSCTANAAAGLLEYFERRANGKYLDASRLFIYKAERDLLGWTGDTGAFLRTAMEALVLFGAPPEKYWPYDGRPAATNTRYDVEPQAFCYAFGANYQTLKYFRLDPIGTAPAQALANIKAYLAGGFPSMFGFPVYPEYDNPLPGALIAYPAPTSRSRGGHANCAVGYDDNLMIGGDKGALLIRNSWGPTWANAGYAWMSYKYVTQGLANDWWSLISAKWVDADQFN
jgi:C1A family cysteine protease